MVQRCSEEIIEINIYGKYEDSLGSIWARRVNVLTVTLSSKIHKNKADNTALSIEDIFCCIPYRFSPAVDELSLLLHFKQAIKYFLDPKTFEKVKFVYPKNKDSVELMRTFFDVENLPREFGGKATLNYDHEEFSRLMAEDDIKTAAFWEIDEKPQNVLNGHSMAEVAPDPISLVSPAS